MSEFLNGWYVKVLSDIALSLKKFYINKKSVCTKLHAHFSFLLYCFFFIAINFSND